jgi:ABC-type sugar transport system permease subunit
MKFDAIIVGGSYAGMSAGLQLARARQKIAIVDAGKRRNRFASESHGFLSQDGRAPGDIAADARSQLLAYPTVEWIEGEAVEPEFLAGVLTHERIAKWRSWIIFLIFVVSPYVQAFYLALTDWTGYSPAFDFVGLQNFAALFGLGDFNPDRVFWAGLRNNLILLLVVPLISIAIALFFASMLNLSGSTKAGQLRGVAGATFYRVLFFVPQVVSVAALAIMFQQVFHPGGLLNSLLRLIGIPNPPSWLADPNTAMLTVIIVMVWMNVGFYMVYFSVAMSGIPRELLEAAAIDKASRFQTLMVAIAMIRLAVSSSE